MRKRKGEGEMMQEAIDKATQLIELLQKENRELKRKLDCISKQNELAQRQNANLQSKIQQLVKQLQMSQQNQKSLQKQLQENQLSFQSLQQSLQKRIHTNKQLHQKISLLNAKLKEVKKDKHDDHTKMLSLENENEYLLKKLSQIEENENSAFQKVNSCHSDRQNQLKEAIRLKEAFSRRCKQLEADNQALISAAAEFKQKAMDREVSTDFQHKVKIQRYRQADQAFLPKTSNFLAKLLRDHLGVQPEETAEKQYNQISSFLDYRLSHIEKLWEGINSKLDKKQSLNISSLHDLNTACHRLASYLAQLINHQN